MKLSHHKRNLLLLLFVLFFFLGIYILASLLSNENNKLTLFSKAVESTKCASNCDSNNPLTLKGGCPCRDKAPWCAPRGYLCDRTTSPNLCQPVGGEKCSPMTVKPISNSGTNAGNECQYAGEKTTPFDTCLFLRGQWFRCVGPDIAKIGDYNSLNPDPTCNEAHPDRPYLPPKISEGLNNLLIEVEKKTNVDKKILKTIMWIESINTYYFMKDEDVSRYSRSNNLLPVCLVSSCSEVGPMQVTTGTTYYTTGPDSEKLCTKCCDSGRYGEKPNCNSGNPTQLEDGKYACCQSYCPNAFDGVYDDLKEMTNNRTPHPCNLRENIYAAALDIKKKSGGVGRNLSKTQVEEIAIKYHGGCGIRTRRLGNLNYCEYLWASYQSE